MRILIVEDDFDSRLVLQEFVSELGEVVVAVDGDEAVHAFFLAHERDRPYDVMFLDIMLPKNDGHTVLRRIREAEGFTGIRGHKLKVIMTTALADSESVKEAHAGRCDGYLKKPFSKSLLKAELKRLGLISES